MTEIKSECAELHFGAHWSTFNVQEEVLRGIQLRKQKSKENETNYDFHGIDFTLPTCSRRQKYVNNILPEATTHKNRHYQKKSAKARLCASKRAPLRIVELAEPSKRHCLNTLKNNYSTLPDYMVERLRSHIMDKKPVVHISDAVNYFKNRRKSSKKCSKIKSKAMLKKYYKIRDLVLLCSIFGYKISKKLNTPVNITLSQKLAKLHSTVSDEINSILRRKKGNAIHDVHNDKILAEVSKIVTIWITSILEETSYQQLLEQLEDIEEEEGPVLDLLDEIINNVADICNSYDSLELRDQNDSDRSDSFCSQKKENINDTVGTIENIDVAQIDVEKSDNVVPENIDDINSQKSKDISYSNENNEVDIQEHLRSILEQRVDKAIISIDSVKQDVFRNITKMIDTDGKPEERNEINGSKISESNINNLIPTPSIDNIGQIDTISSSESEVNGVYLDLKRISNNAKSNSIEVDFNLMEQQNFDILKSGADAVHENAHIMLADQDLDDEVKKVKFSNLSMEIEGNGTGINMNSSELESNEPKEQVDWKSSKEYILSHFNVAPPNHNLLSFADEAWPEYSMTSLLKATESVSKSVTSLGKIPETDEQNLLTISENVKNTDITDGNINLNLMNIQSTSSIDEIFKKTNKESVELNTIINKYLNDKENSPQDPSPKTVDLNKEQPVQNHAVVAKIKPNTTVKIEDTKHPQTIKYFNDQPLNSLNKTVNDHNLKIKDKCAIENDSITLNHIMNNILLSARHGSCTDYFKSNGTTISKDEENSQRLLTNKKKLKYSTSSSHKIIDYNDNIAIQHGSSTTILLKKNMRRADTTKQYQKYLSRCFLGIDKINYENSFQMQKWCVGLLNVTANLDLWGVWIQNVCLNVMNLKISGSYSTSFSCLIKRTNAWTKLKKNIDGDAQKWMILHRRHRRDFKIVTGILAAE